MNWMEEIGYWLAQHPIIGIIVVLILGIFVLKMRSYNSKMKGDEIK